MKIALRFAVAKYVPNIHRMEPRNVGVIVWGEGGLTAAKFLGEQPNGLHFPAMIDRDSRHAYREWLTFWRYHLNAVSIRSSDGKDVPRESPDFLTVILSKSKEYFRLVDGGFMLDKVDSRQSGEVLSELFATLVEKERKLPRSKSEAIDLAAATTSLLAATGIAERDDYHPNLPIPRQVRGVLREFTLDVALGAIGNPLVVLHKVLLSRPQSIDSTAFMFETLIADRRKPLRQENCAALVNGSQATNDAALSGMKMLEQMVEVIDVSDAKAPARLTELAKRADQQQI